MVFNSLHFIAFFVVVYTIYRLLPFRYQNWFLVGASYYFYAAWNWKFLGLLVASTVVDYGCAIYIAEHAAPRPRRAALTVSVTFNLCMLGFFKYFNFFEENVRTLLAALGFRPDPVTLEVLLPIGISFYTFMTMSYVIDVYRRETEPCRSVRDFALFVSYFPHLVAGPILRAGSLLPQLVKPRVITRLQLQEGAWLIALGYFKKVFVADNLATVVDAAFAPDSPASGIEMLCAIYAFAFQIYGDFSGYTDIARGTSKLMGIELNLNFRVPYLAVSPSDFWHRWHISLSTWLRDYLYIPLGGSRGTRAATNRNLMITMALGGLWHGAAWPYVIWGIYHGSLLILYRWLGRLLRRDWVARLRVWPGRLVPTFVMFQLTCIGWLIFRARSASQIVDAGRRLMLVWTSSSVTMDAYVWPLLFYALPIVALQLYYARENDTMAVLRLPFVARWSIYVGMVYLVVLFGDFGGSEFIYFQF